ncbi:PREDICTED: protein-cysteine N-palmitoyltransferase HHAT [Condylura cristata]|uniref:protein-cysteine N-palmitoyltransferase HHAT n=1 Tax=Condylura cristata TaxID=143302 RepID=UPI0003346A28|nr:PREDICTED: protein-cysteine N-palmitoyltransferase HHAT [Condylura cristata]
MLPRWELGLYLLASLGFHLYSFLEVYRVSREHEEELDREFGLETSSLFRGLKKDPTDFEWSFWMDWGRRQLAWLLLGHAAVSQLALRLARKHRPWILTLYGVGACWRVLGAPGLGLLLLHTTMAFGVAQLQRPLLCWVCSLLLLSTLRLEDAQDVKRETDQQEGSPQTGLGGSRRLQRPEGRATTVPPPRVHVPSLPCPQSRVLLAGPLCRPALVTTASPRVGSFDVGLHDFLIRYLYIPAGGSQRGLLGTLFSTALTFAFVSFWHGGRDFLWCWAALNWLGVTAESGVRRLLETPGVRDVVVSGADGLRPGGARGRESESARECRKRPRGGRGQRLAPGPRAAGAGRVRGGGQMVAPAPRVA